jgi:hypothetical protein
LPNIQKVYDQVLENLNSRKENCLKEIQKEEADMTAKISTETLRTGFDKTVCSSQGPLGLDFFLKKKNGTLEKITL